MICIDDNELLVIPTDVNKFRTVRIEDMFYIMESRKNIIIVTMTDGEQIINKYSSPIELWQYIQSNHDNFMEMDRSLLVNMGKIKMYNSYMNRVYASDTVSVQINGGLMKKLKSGFAHLEDLSQVGGFKVEYAPMRSSSG